MLSADDWLSGILGIHLLDDPRICKLKSGTPEDGLSDITVLD
jgi:hypothetical protein